MRRGFRPGFWIILVCAAAAALYVGAWFVVADRVGGAITAWIDGAPARGTTITFKALERGGFPFAVRWTLIAPGLSMVWARGDLGITAKDMSLRVEIWNPSHIALSGHDVRLTLNDAPSGKRWILGAMEGSATVYPSRQGATDVTYAMTRLRIDETKLAGGSAPARHVGQAETVTGTARVAAAPAPGRALAVHVASIDLASVSSPRTERMRLTGAGRLRASVSMHGGIGRGSVEDFVAWRDLGGILDIQSLKIGWPPFDLAFDGTLALDAELRPIGAGTMDLRGLGPLIDQQVDAGAMKPSDASVAKLALALMTRPAKDAGAPVVRLPLTAQDGKLRAGPFTIGTLRRLVR